MNAIPIGGGASDRSSAEAVAERWVALTLESWPAALRPFPGEEKDPFRNPVGGTIRRSLNILAREVLGDMDQASVAGAIEALVQVRAVQDVSPADALRFIFGLRTAIRDLSGAVAEPLQARIEALALLAFNQYATCRERIFDLRVKEIRFRAQCGAIEATL